MMSDDVLDPTNSSASISAAHFQQVLDVSRMLAVTTELDALLQHIAQAATSLLSCERASIFLHDPKTDELTTRVALQSKEIRVPSSAGIVGHVFRSNTVLHVQRPYEDARFNQEVDRRTGFVTRNLLAAPMVDLSRKPIGAIQAINSKSPDGFSATDQLMIGLLADQAGVAIQRYRLQEAAVEAMYLRREMELASQVQNALIPKTFPELAGFQVAGWTRPASVTGGDCFDLWKTTDGRLGMLLGDASGHGLGPALIVSQVRTLVRGMCELQRDPNEILACVNARLAEDLSAGSFVTAFLGYLEPDGTLTWTSAGHGPILLRDAHGGTLRQLEPPGPPLGILPDYMGGPTEPAKLSRGGTLVIASDGIFDARSPAGELYETPRVVEFFERHADEAAPQQSSALRSELDRWHANHDPDDDQTLIIVTRDRDGG